ncbi:MAG: hypothetical protein FJ343_06540 [Sphingomonadales bacterium]|nr:hypothetical protein [Sphingomonadales bacterium]
MGCIHETETDVFAPEKFEQPHQTGDYLIGPQRIAPPAQRPGELLEVQMVDTLVRWWCWKDCNGHQWQTWVDIPQNVLEKSRQTRQEVTLSSWIRNNPNYRIMVEHDAPHIRALAGRLRKMALKSGLNISQTAKMVVQMVQSIPYTLVHPHSHPEMESKEIQKNNLFIRKYHQNPRHTPLSKEPFGGCYAHADPAGVLSPIEFMADFKGDCDTRTVFLYTLLRSMGLKAVVMNGPGHSMLGLPYAPKRPGLPHLLHQGQKYYFVETTVLVRNSRYCGPDIGEVPRNFRAEQWRIVLH